MKITLGEALHLLDYEGCLEDDSEDYPRSTKENLYYIADDETNTEKCDDGARRHVKIIFQAHNELYAFDAILPYYDQGDVDVKLAEGESKYLYGSEFDEDIQDKLVLCIPVTKKTRMVEQVYYE